jgi:hypothetical protein
MNIVKCCGDMKSNMTSNMFGTDTNPFRAGEVFGI